MSKNTSRVSQLFDQHQQFVQDMILLHELACRRVGVSAADQHYLLLFSRYGMMTAGELARRSGLTTGAVTGVIARLKKMRMIRQTFDPADRRKVVLEPSHSRLTAHMEAYQNVCRNIVESSFNQLTASKSAILSAYFEKSHAVVTECLDEKV